MRWWSLFHVSLLPLVACESPQEEPTRATPPAAVVASTVWRTLGTWSGSGDRQTESFDVTTGSMRLTWEAIQEGDPGTNHLRVSLHSAISGRPLQMIVDTQEGGAGTVDLAANPRVAYLQVESEQVRWLLTLQEGLPRSAVGGSARD